MTLPADALEIRMTACKGRGVFATRPISRGMLVLRPAGIILRTDQLRHDMLALQVGDDLWLTSDGTALDDCINHGCEPNLGFIDGSINLFSLRDIEPGEELTWDYSTSLSDPDWRLNCLCGSPRCRGAILPWGQLSRTDRDRLRPIALEYLRRR